MARKKAVEKTTDDTWREIEAVVAYSYDAIIGESLTGIIRSWNGGAEKMFQYKAKEVIGKSKMFLVPKELKHETKMLLGKVAQGEVVEDYNTMRLRKDGSAVDVAISIAPIKDARGKITGAAVVERDVTERRKAERRIQELNEVRNKFIAIISHQLRTPLTAVNWNLEMLLSGSFGTMDAAQSTFLRATYDASVELTHRIHDLLTAMDVEEGRIQMEKGEVAVDSIVATVMQEMKKKCALKQIVCTYVAPKKDPPALEGDAEKIRTVVMKFVENAVQYTKEKGVIAASLFVKKNNIRFEVKDNGVGIPAAEQHRIFTRFFRASNAVTMQPDAFGLGLFIAKHFIDQHGGTIGFESKNGKGSTFWFELPCRKCE